jgi:hypothetical protein
MSINNSRIIQNVKVMLIKGAKGDRGEKGEDGDYIANQYTSLGSKPQINGVTLEGDLTTAGIKIIYPDLNYKPQINGVTLSGNKSLSSLGIASASDTYTKSEMSSFIILDVVEVQMSGSVPGNTSATQSLDVSVSKTGYKPVAVIWARANNSFYLPADVALNTSTEKLTQARIQNLQSTSQTLQMLPVAILYQKA